MMSLTFAWKETKAASYKTLERESYKRSLSCNTMTENLPSVSSLHQKMHVNQASERNLVLNRYTHIYV